MAGIKVERQLVQAKKYYCFALANVESFRGFVGLRKVYEVLQALNVKLSAEDQALKTLVEKKIEAFQPSKTLMIDF